STLGEGAWVSTILRHARAPLLLDLHNLYANAVNEGIDPFEHLASFDLGNVAAIHLAGGRRVRGSRGSVRVLDDHLHDVPDVCFELLAEVASRVPRPLTVILERDGSFPTFESLLAELDRARAAVAIGRKREKAECRA